MKVNTKLFGEIEIDDEKVITFEGGIVGFPDLKKFALMHDEDNGDEGRQGLSFMVSLDEPAFAMPVVNPLVIKDSYNPVVEDDYLIPLGELKEEDMLVLVTVTVPHDITKMTVNLMAPFILNAATKKAVQVILDEDDKYPVKYPIYEILAKAKDEAIAKAKGE
ncbi:MAG: flagellar assembly protein FliW [Lachnospiraceae bacterium]|nr:flagellar assembly protein FliW [Lachnospiraceae bacterium]